MNIKIEKGIKIPPRGTGISLVLKNIEIGDSFKYEKSKRTTASSFAKRVGITLATRSIEEEPNMIRIWRIK